MISSMPMAGLQYQVSFEIKNHGPFPWSEEKKYGLGQNTVKLELQYNSVIIG